MLGERESGIFEIETENWPALLVFIACGTQWRFLPSGYRLGIDYTALETVMRLQQIENHSDVFRRVQIMERAALALLNKQ